VLPLAGFVRPACGSPAKIATAARIAFPALGHGWRGRWLRSHRDLCCCPAKTRWDFVIKRWRSDRQAVVVRSEGLRFELRKNGNELTTETLDDRPAVLPNPVQTLELAGRISLVHVNVVHAEA
jgi:hypothetical protein